jgi:hypothetical protein
MRFLLAQMESELTRFYDFSRVDVDIQPAIIEMLNKDLTTTKSSQEVDFNTMEEVVVFALETGVRLLLDLELHISRENTRHLITFASEVDLMATLDTTVDMNMQHLALDDGLLAHALLAPVLISDGLTLTLAVGADSLEALNHRAHLSHHSLHTSTLTTWASSNSTLFASSTIARRADDGFLEGQLGDFASVDVLEGDLVNVVDGSCFLGTSVSHATTEHTTEPPAEAATAEELSEEILSGHTTTGTHSALLKTLLSELVIQLSLLGIG